MLSPSPKTLIALLALCAAPLVLALNPAGGFVETPAVLSLHGLSSPLSRSDSEPATTNTGGHASGSAAQPALLRRQDITLSFLQSIPPECSGTCDGIEALQEECKSSGSGGAAPNLPAGAPSGTVTVVCEAMCTQDNYDLVLDCTQCEIDARGYTFSEQIERGVQQMMSSMGRRCSVMGDGDELQQRRLNLTISSSPNMPTGAASPQMGGPGSMWLGPMVGALAATVLGFVLVA